MSIGAERCGGITGWRTTGHAALAKPFIRREGVSTPFRGSISRREDVELLGRKPETGGTPAPPGVEFVR